MVKTRVCCDVPGCTESVEVTESTPLHRSGWAQVVFKNGQLTIDRDVCPTHCDTLAAGMGLGPRERASLGLPAKKG